MVGSLRRKNRRDISATKEPTEVAPKSNSQEVTSDLEIYSKEVFTALMADDLPPTPNNFSLYFDRLLEDKSESLRKQISSILELEENNDDENTIALEQSLKKGFGSIKNILSVAANLYKNMSLMTKILDKKQKELGMSSDLQSASSIVSSLGNDISKLNNILKNQSTHIKTLYDETATIVRNVDNETIFDNQYGVYNRRYLMSKIEQEIELVSEFKHPSSLIMIELSRELRESVNQEKAITLMVRTISRLLLKTSRRSDIVAHYKHGVFAMLLKHTDIEAAKKASERLCDLVAGTNFFLGDREIKLKISIGVTNITTLYSVEEIVVSAMNGMEKAYADKKHDYSVCLRDTPK